MRLDDLDMAEEYRAKEGAHVECIYEPLQTVEEDGNVYIREEDPNLPKADAVAKALGLQRVGACRFASFLSIIFASLSGALQPSGRERLNLTVFSTFSRAGFVIAHPKREGWLLIPPPNLEGGVR